MKWLVMTPATIFGLLLVFWLGMKTYYAVVVNESVTEELRQNPGGERAALVMLLTFPDGRELPVNYLREGNQVFAGADGQWWRAFRDGAVPVKLYIRGEELSGRARTIMDDPQYTKDVFERLRPNVPKWLPDWLNAHLVVIDLDA